MKDYVKKIQINKNLHFLNIINLVVPRERLLGIKDCLLGRKDCPELFPVLIKEIHFCCPPRRGIV
jgi:hypothetical protein